jgi:hypothetical protein
MKSLRFILSLDAGIKLEQDVIDYLEAHPQGRRQNKMRELLVLGVAASRNGRQSYDRTHYSGFEPQSHRVCVYLRDDSPDDAPVMAAIKDVLRPYQPARLKEALVLGHLELSTQPGTRGDVLAVTDQVPPRTMVSLAHSAADSSPLVGQDVGRPTHRSSSIAGDPVGTVVAPRQVGAGLESRVVQRATDSYPLRVNSAANAPPSETLLTSAPDDKSVDSLGEVTATNGGENATSTRQVIQGLFQ